MNKPNKQKKILELISDYGNVASCKIIIQKSIAFLHSNNEQMELEIKNTILCTLISLKVKSVQFSHSVMSNSLQLHGLQHAKPPCPSPTPRVYSNSCPLS